MSILTYCFLFFTIILFALFIMEPHLRKNEVLQKSVINDIDNSFLISSSSYVKIVSKIININPNADNIKYLERLKSAGLYGYIYWHIINLQNIYLQFFSLYYFQLLFILPNHFKKFHFLRRYLLSLLQRFAGFLFRIYILKIKQRRGEII